MGKQRKIPMRICVGCREKKPKRELLRLVRTPENEVKLDLSGKCPAAALISAGRLNA